MAFLLLPTLHNCLLKQVKNGTPFVLRLQKAQSNPLDRLCILCAAMGNEFSYLLALPFIVWNLDMEIGRKMIVLWGIGFYISNYLKDLLLLPRPYHVSDDVVKVEVCTEIRNEKFYSYMYM